MIQSSNYGRSKRFLSSQVQGDWLWHPLSLLLSGDWGSLMGVNQPEHEDDHSFPCRPQAVEWVKQYLCSPCMPVWNGQEQLQLYVILMKLRIPKKLVNYIYTRDVYLNFCRYLRCWVGLLGSAASPLVWLPCSWTGGRGWTCQQSSPSSSGPVSVISSEVPHG